MHARCVHMCAVGVGAAYGCKVSEEVHAEEEEEEAARAHASP